MNHLGAIVKFFAYEIPDRFTWLIASVISVMKSHFRFWCLAKIRLHKVIYDIVD